MRFVKSSGVFGRVGRTEFVRFTTVYTTVLATRRALTLPAQSPRRYSQSERETFCVVWGDMNEPAPRAPEHRSEPPSLKNHRPSAEVPGGSSLLTNYYFLHPPTSLSSPLIVRLLGTPPLTYLPPWQRSIPLWVVFMQLQLVLVTLLGLPMT